MLIELLLCQAKQDAINTTNPTWERYEPKDNHHHFYRPFSSLLEISNSSLMFLSSHERHSLLLGIFRDEKVQLGEHNRVEIEMWEASVSLTIPKWIFPHEKCRWVMEQWGRQLSRITSCGRGCAQGAAGSNASTWKSSRLYQQGPSSAQVLWSIEIKAAGSD